MKTDPALLPGLRTFTALPVAEQVKVWRQLTFAQQQALWARIRATGRKWFPLPGPQRMCWTSKAFVVGTGGAAGGGKTDTLAGLLVERARRALVVRSEKADLEGLIQRMVEILGTTEGLRRQPTVWKLPHRDALVEFGGLKDIGSEQGWRGRPHDHLLFDELTEIRESQFRFLMNWVRTSDPDLTPQVVATFNPPSTVEGRWVIKYFGPWLDRRHPRPAKPGELRWFTSRGEDQDWEVPDDRPFVWRGPKDNLEADYDFDPAEVRPEDIVRPTSRTFIPSRIADNPFYLHGPYLRTVQSAPEPLRSQLLYGDFDAGILDSEWQVIPTKWVLAAQERWTPDGWKLAPQDVLGVDVARSGKDKTVLVARHGNWFGEPVVYPGKDTPDGPEVLGHIARCVRDFATVAIDVVGVGGSPFDFARHLTDIAVYPVVASEAPTRLPGRGSLEYKNMRAQMWWEMRELLDPANGHNVALPPGPQVLADLTAMTWDAKTGKIRCADREDLKKKIGRSPDIGTAIVQAAMPLVKRKQVDLLVRAERKRGPMGYDPYKDF